MELESKKLEALQAFINPEMFMAMKGRVELESAQPNSKLYEWVRSELAKRGKHVKRGSKESGSIRSR